MSLEKSGKRLATYVKGDTLNFAIVDLECTDLKSDKGFLLCAGIKPLGGKPYVLTYDDAGFGKTRRELDTKLVRLVKKEMEKYDGWITWNGLLFDLPWLDDRLLICGHPKLAPRFARGLDMMWHAARGKSMLSRRALNTVARALGCPFLKTPLDMQMWKDVEADAIVEALAGLDRGRKGYNKIVYHCKMDLKVTEWVYEKLKSRVGTISLRKT